jgi:hypothetical protein
MQDLAADLIEGRDRSRLERRLSAVAQRAIKIGSAPAKVLSCNPLARPTTARVPLEVFISRSNHQLLVSGNQRWRLGLQELQKDGGGQSQILWLKLLG